MSYRWDDRNRRYRWEFKATIAGHRYRFSRLLPKGWREGQVKKYDQQETARTYARLSAGSAGLIDQVVALYLAEATPNQRAGIHAARCLSYMMDDYRGLPLSDLGAVSRAVIKKYAHLAPSTIRQRLSYLRAAANYALERHGIGKLEFIAQMSFPVVSNERNVFLTRKQIVQLARACKDRGARAWILMTFATGSRPGECHRSEPHPQGLLLPADKAGDRIVKPVPQKVQRYLRHWPMKYGYTFYSRKFREARAAVGLDHVKPHDERHSTASALLLQGKTLGQVAQVLDHKSIASTRRYSHLATDDKRKMLEDVWKKK